MALFCNISDKG